MSELRDTVLVALVVLVLSGATGCGALACASPPEEEEIGPDPLCFAASTPAPGAIEMQVQELWVESPTTLGIFNGMIVEYMRDERMVMLVQIDGLDGDTPTVTIGPGWGDDLAAGGPYRFVAGEELVLEVEYDWTTRRIRSTATGSLRLYLPTPNGPLPLRFDDVVLDVGVDPLFDAMPTETCGTPSTLTGNIAVEEACAFEMDLGSGAVLSLLDVLDGSTGDVEPADLVPPCAPGGGSDNVPPGVDTDGDGMGDAYAVEAVIGSCATCVSEDGVVYGVEIE